MNRPMAFPDQETIARLRKAYPVGCRIVLDEMEDPYTKIPIGTQGTCQGVDDAGSITTNWDCGSSLSIAYGADRAHRVASEAEVKQSLDWLGRRQREAKGGGHCPRCGQALDSFSRHALSRYADVTVCDGCGTEEALERARLNTPKPLTDWWCVKNGWVL